jgi:hypothetical protein
MLQAAIDKSQLYVTGTVRLNHHGRISSYNGILSEGTAHPPRSLSRRADDSGRHVRERRSPDALVEILTSASRLLQHARGWSDRSDNCDAGVN